MNRTKRSISQRLNKKMHKELKAAQRPLPPAPHEYSDELTARGVLKKYPQKVIKAKEGILQGFEKRFKATKSKKLKKHSKRTNCGKIDEHSPPAHVHVEGIRWVKNLRAQNLDRRQKLAKKMSRKRK